MHARTDIDLLHADIARQHHANLGVRAECLVRELRVAGAQDCVASEIDTELIAKCLVNIDTCEHAEALGFQSFGHPVNGGIKTDVDVD